MKKVSLILFIALITMMQMFQAFAANMEDLTTYDLLPEYVTPSEEPYDAPPKQGFESTESLTRFECLTAIMKAAGATKESCKYFNTVLYDSYSGIPNEIAYVDGNAGHVKTADGRDLRANLDGSTFDIYKYTANTGIELISLAFYYGIAKGEFYDGFRYFYFERPVTAYESAAFMVRLLEKGLPSDLEMTYQLAKEFGIVLPEDEAYQDGDQTITPDYFCTMLLRFLELPRHYYFSNRAYDTEMYEDEERSMTYLEYLETRETYATDRDES